MRTLILGLASFLAVAGATSAATTRAELTAPITSFMDAFDKGDMKTATAAYAADVSIIDDVPPYVWRGPTAVANWAHDLGADDAKNGVAGEKVTLGDVLRTETDGRHAYVVMAATYSFTDHGKPMHEPARMTFTLRKATDGWKIAAWTWTGPKPSSGDAPAPKR